MQRWEDAVKNKKVLFLTTKNIDYIRNAQEIQLLRESANEVRLLYSSSKWYIFRIIEIYCNLLFMDIKIFNTVFIGFSPQLILPVFYRKFRKKKIIVDFFISVYDTMVNDRKKFSPAGLLAKWCHHLDEKTIQNADFVLSDTNAHAKYFHDEFKASYEKLETLYLEADKSIFFPRNMDKLEKLKDKFVVLYFGSVLPLQGVDIVLNAFSRLKEQKEIYFYMIGKIKNKYEKSSSDNIEHIDWVSQEKLAEYIAMADLCLAGHFNSKIEKAKRTIPGKAYIYEAMEKTMVLGDNAANRELFEEDRRHYFIEMGDVEALVRVILKVKDNCY